MREVCEFISAYSSTEKEWVSLLSAALALFSISTSISYRYWWSNSDCYCSPQALSPALAKKAFHAVTLRINNGAHFPPLETPDFTPPSSSKRMCNDAAIFPPQLPRSFSHR